MVDIAEVKTSELKRKIVYPEGHDLAGDWMGITISVVQLEDDKTQQARRRIMDSRLKKDAKGKTLTAEEVEENQLDILYSCMTGWDWSGGEDEKVNKVDAATFNGETPAFNRRDVKKVLATLPWFRKQVDDAIDEAQGFFES